MKFKLSLLLCIALSGFAQVQEKVQDGLTAETIAEKAFSQALLGVKQGTANMKMVIVSSSGDKKERFMNLKMRRGDDGGAQFLIKFDKPADVKGTAFLVRERKGQMPDQYIYLPAAKVVKQVAAGNATASFFGSDFLYADLLPFPNKKGEVELNRLPDTKIAGQDSYVVEILPKTPGSPYGRLVSTVRKGTFAPLQMEFFDPNKKLMKTLRVKKIEKVDGQSVPVDLEMKNTSGGYTSLQITGINTKVKLSAKDFTDEAMQK